MTRATVTAVLFALTWHALASAQEARTYYGRILDEWIRVFRDAKSSNDDRQRAANAFACFGPEARDVVPDLVREVQQGPLKQAAADALVRIGAGTEVTVPYFIEQFVKQGCQHLTGMGTFGINAHFEQSLVRIGGPAVPALVDLLQGPDQDMRVCAAKALGEIGPAARAAVPALIQNRGSKYAVRALGQIGPDARAAVPMLTARLDDDGGPDLDVVMALDQIGALPVRKLADTLVQTGDPFIASYELAWLGRRARDAAPRLREALADKRSQVRLSAAVALAHIEPETSEAAIPVLVEGLNHVDDEQLDTDGVPQALAQFGPRARTALPALMALARRSTDDREILKTLVHVDPEGRECVPALASALSRSNDYEIVSVAARCLRLLGPSATDAVPALTATLTRDFDSAGANGYDPYESAGKALQRIGPEAKSAIPALIAALKHRQRHGDDEPEETSGAAAAAEVLGSLGPDAKAAVPALIEAARTREHDSANWRVRQAAILALGRIGAEARVAVPVLRSMFKDPRDAPQAEIAVALVELAPDGKAVAEKWLAGTRGWVVERSRVLAAVGRTGVEADCLARNYLESVERMLAHPDPRDGDLGDHLEWWFDALAAMGTAGHAAIPRLNEYRKHSNLWIRAWANQTLEKISPPGRPGT